MNEFTKNDIGQTVHCYWRKETGVIHQFDSDRDFQVFVIFDDLSSAWYSKTGVKAGLKEQSLVFENGSIFYDFGTPVPTYRAFNYIGDIKWCFVGHNKRDVLDKKYMQLVIAGNSGNYLAINCAKVNTNVIDKATYECAMALTDDEIRELQLNE